MDALEKGVDVVEETCESARNGDILRRAMNAYRDGGKAMQDATSSDVVETAVAMEMAKNFLNSMINMIEEDSR